jgi:Flp pilus assembly protein TadB
MDTFQKVFVACISLAVAFSIFQEWREKKKGSNLQDMHVKRKILYRCLPIMAIPFLFMDIPWIWRILIFVIMIIFMEGYMLFMKNARRLLGINLDKKDQTGK